MSSGDLTDAELRQAADAAREAYASAPTPANGRIYADCRARVEARAAYRRWEQRQDEAAKTDASQQSVAPKATMKKPAGSSPRK